MQISIFRIDASVICLQHLYIYIYNQVHLWELLSAIQLMFYFFYFTIRLCYVYINKWNSWRCKHKIYVNDERTPVWSGENCHWCRNSFRCIEIISKSFCLNKHDIIETNFPNIPPTVKLFIFQSWLYDISSLESVYVSIWALKISKKRVGKRQRFRTGLKKIWEDNTLSNACRHFRKLLLFWELKCQRTHF